MQVIRLKPLGTLGRRMTRGGAPPRAWSRKFPRAWRGSRRQGEFPGASRPGKAPMKMVEAQYADKVLEEVAGDLIRSTLYEAVNESV